jgi:hypothetical protein
MTIAGLVGMFTSFVIQKGDFDPTAFGVAIASIFIAIVGVALILEQPKSNAETTQSSPKNP